MPQTDSPYLILSQRSPTTFEVANLEDPDIPIGVYHTSALRLHQDQSSKPLTPLRKRGRLRKTFWPLAEAKKSVPPSVGSVSVVDVLLLHECVPFYVILCPFCSQPQNKGFGHQGSCLHLDIANKHLHSHTLRRFTI
ncbi:hypothetical protein TNIN_437131 [Trichonephila inaurata madagascariensis]|uniref:Uncharacterized protein n=1 Tax=Trichonephila inaurata madagascariensis TaxID=2747483 RepID=A0A8X7C3I0_9ARAC|nr:hypothetical protein TNIN_437131 [Trichonephila inaurata madagascariensis]